MNPTDRSAMLSMFMKCQTAEGFHRAVQIALETDDVFPSTPHNYAFWAVAFGIKPGRGAKFPYWRETGVVAYPTARIHRGNGNRFRLYMSRQTHVNFKPSNPSTATREFPQIIGRIIPADECRELLFGIYGDRRHLIHRAFASWHESKAFTPEMASAWPARITGTGDALVARWKQQNQDDEGITEADSEAMLAAGEC